MRLLLYSAMIKKLLQLQKTASLKCMTVPAVCIMEVVATATGIRRVVDSCRAVVHQVTLGFQTENGHTVTAYL